jgi:hypothetical protein
LNYRPLPRPLAVVAAAVQVREDKKRERNKKRQIRRRVKGKEEALTAAAAGLAERGEKEKEVSVAAVVATTVRKKKPTEKKSSEAQFEESLTSRLLELSHLSTEDKEFILSMLDKLISAFTGRGGKEATVVDVKETKAKKKDKKESNKEGIVDDAAAERGEKEIEEKSKETAAVVAATSIAAEKQKSLSDIEKTRRKLDAIKGRELTSIRLSAKDMIELNKAIQDLDKNKALIEDTYMGTPGQKVSTWSRK